MTRVTRRLAPAAALLAALGLAACGGEETPTPPPTSGATSEATPESLDKPEQQEIDADEAKAALPTVEDMPDSSWGLDGSTFSDSPITYDPADCGDVELDSEAVRTFRDEHRTVREAARFSTSAGDGSLQIIATYVESFDAPFPLSALDAAGEHVTDCGSYTRTQDGHSSERTAEAISVPSLGDRSFGLRMDGVDRLYLRSGHNLVTVMVLTQDDEYDGTLMTTLAEGIVEDLKKTS